MLLRDATRLSPKLLLLFASDRHLNASSISSNGVTYPAVTAPSLNITIGFQPHSYLPSIIRSYEDHHIYGLSTSDFKVYNYTTVSGVKFPRRIKLYYNENNLVLDTIYDKVKVNPQFAGDFFGWSVSGGDVNGDKIADLIIGAPGNNNDDGIVYIVYGVTVHDIYCFSSC